MPRSGCDDPLPSSLSPAPRLSLYASLAMLPSTVTCRGHAHLSYYGSMSGVQIEALYRMMDGGEKWRSRHSLPLLPECALLRGQYVELLVSYTIDDQNCTGDRRGDDQLRRTNQSPPPSEPSPASISSAAGLIPRR